MSRRGEKKRKASGYEEERTHKSSFAIAVFPTPG